MKVVQSCTAMSHLHLQGLHPHRHLITSIPTPAPTAAVRSRSFPIQIPKSTALIHIRTPSIHQRNTIKCMASERRVKRVAKQIQREISTMLITDKVLQRAVSPEAALGADRYMSSVTSISEVVVTSDLQLVKVYVSVFGDDRGKKVTLAGLKSKAKYVQSQLGKRMRLRLAPEVRFIEDEALERGNRVLEILDRLKAEREKAGEKADEISELQDDDEWEDEISEPQDGEEWDDDDLDEEDIIYVK